MSLQGKYNCRLTLIIVKLISISNIVDFIYQFSYYIIPFAYFILFIILEWTIEPKFRISSLNIGPEFCKLSLYLNLLIFFHPKDRLKIILSDYITSSTDPYVYKLVFFLVLANLLSVFICYWIKFICISYLKYKSNSIKDICFAYFLIICNFSFGFSWLGLTSRLFLDIIRKL